jgi:hypothetical protein
VAAGAVLCVNYAIAAVKEFVGAYCKDEEGIAEGIIYRKNGEGKQRHEKLITSPIKIELRQL